MNIRIVGKDVEITEWLEQYIEKKIGKLDRYLPRAQEALVELRHEATKSADQRNVVEITLYDSKGAVLRGEERSSDLFAAIDAVVDTMYRQISRYKGRRQARYRHANAEEEVWAVSELEEVTEGEEEAPRIVRVKRFAMAPMTPEEAIEQMELLGHSFFVFYNPDEGNINVVYRRKDGNYGLIIPELI